jgi:hypothetical protein
MALRIDGMLNFVIRSDHNNRKHNGSEAGSTSLLCKSEAPTLLVPLEIANHKSRESVHLMFLRNVGPYKNHIASNPKWQHSWCHIALTDWDL